MGEKSAVLMGLRTCEFSAPLYVTDTVRDVRICQELRIPVCAMAWASAFDTLDDLQAASPTYLALDLSGLDSILRKLNFNSISKGAQ